MTTTIIHADEDASVNFVTTLAEGAFEARYVRRTDDYFIAYVSSQAGCDRSCRFCHLTATGQTSMVQATADDLLDQITTVLRHHSAQTIRPRRMNVNFMARGEPLLNPTLLDNGAWSEFRIETEVLAAMNGIDAVRFNVSTIMPNETMDVDLADTLRGGDMALFYSLYSMRPSFRKRWLPKAADPIAALDRLTRWQEATNGTVALHWSFIEGENDDENTIREIVEAVHASGLKPKFNAVRYNPFDGRRGREPPEEVVERNFAILAEAFGHPESRIVPRVGFSAKASCGMFVERS